MANPKYLFWICTPYVRGVRVQKPLPTPPSTFKTKEEEIEFLYRSLNLG